MQDYLQWKRTTTKNPATAKHYERWVRKFHTFRGVDNTYTLEDISRFKKFLIESEYSPKNIQYGLSILKDYLGYQIAIHKLDFPLALFKVSVERSESHIHIAETDYFKMLSVLPQNEPLTLQRRLMLMFLWDTGLRGGELLRLKLSDLKDRKAIILNEKNNRSRLISWSRDTEKMLRLYLPLRKHLESHLETKDRNPYLFVSFKWRPLKPLTTRQLERIIIEVKKKARIRKPIRPHSFRHGFVHRKLDEGKSITTVAQMLGHSSTVNVLTYAQLNGREIREAWGVR